MVNTELIKKRCEEMDVTYKQLCELLNLTLSGLMHKLNNRRKLKLSEARLLQVALNIPDSEFKDYFIWDGKEKEIWN